jgi:hypothetical protein
VDDRGIRRSRSDDEFFESVKRVFPPRIEQQNEAAEPARRFQLVEMKFGVAGGSARLMALDSALDFQILSDALYSLLSLYHSGDSSDVGLISA